MGSQSGIGQQITQRTTQQGRPQIRVVVTGRQVVNANQDDLVQDDDLASSLGHTVPKRCQGVLSL